MIQSLFSNDAERSAARAVASAMAREPQIAGKTEALLHELARPHDGRGPRGWDYISSFMKDGLGIPEHFYQLDAHCYRRA